MSKMENLLRWVGLARMILPGVLVSAGVSAQRAGQVTNMVIDAEKALGPGSGPAKLQHVVDGVRDGMVVSGASQATIDATLQGVTDGVKAGIALVNDTHAVKVAHQAGDELAHQVADGEGMPPADNGGATAPPPVDLPAGSSPVDSLDPPPDSL